MNTKTNAFKSILASVLCAVGFAASAADPITYLDWDAATQQLVEKTITDYTVYNGEGELDDGTTYVVKTSQEVFPREFLYVNGYEGSPTRLILCDGVTLTVRNGIFVEDGCVLIICGQAGGTGALVATGGDGLAGIGSGYDCAGGTIMINGGIVTATGGSNSAGIGGGAGCSCGTVMINGGTVKATGTNGAAGIGGGAGEANTGTVMFGGSGFSVLAGANAGAAVSVEQDAYTGSHSAAYVFIKEPVFGSEGNPWKIGTPNAADVTAYTNGVGGLVVKGAGAMKDFAEIKDVPWGQGIASVTIGERVTGIGAKSFNGSALGSVMIPASVTNIGAAAFSACASLSKVELKALTPPTLGGDAFAGCAEGLKIYVPCGAGKAYRAAWPDHASRIIDAVKVLSDEFTVDLRTSVELAGETTVSNVMWSATAWGAEPAANVTVGYVNESTGATGVLAEGLEDEDAADFDLPAKDGGYKLTHSTGNLKSFVTFTLSGTGNPVGSDSNPWEIGSGEDDTVIAYRNDDGELIIGGSGAMKGFSEGAVPWDSSDITSVTIGRNVTAIGDSAFYGYAKLTNVTFATGAKLESIGKQAFAECPSMLALEVPAGVTNCGPAVIVGTPNVTVSENNKTFAVVGGALCDIKSNKVISGLDAAVVTIPEGMVEIAECAFSTNGALTSVTIPASVTNIAAEAFKGCANLTNVFVRAEDPPTLGEDTFKGCNDGLKIYVPDGKDETYKAASGWSDYAGKINEMTGEGTKVSPWTAGTGVTAYIENGTLHIEGFGAMEDFTATSPTPWKDAASDIKSVEIGKGVTKVGNAAFVDCSITAPGTFTVDNEEFELNLLAFVSADKMVTNAPATGVFRVVTSETGKAESVIAFGPKDSTDNTRLIEGALFNFGTTPVLVLTLADVVNRDKVAFTLLAGDEPYSKTMQIVLDEVFEALNGAKSYDDIVAIENKYIGQIAAQAEKDKTHEIEGTDITWRVMDGSLVIEGEGEMPDFVEPAFTNGAPWDAYAGDISNATVAAGIESLGAAAFANCPTGTNKTVFFENPKPVINLVAFVSNDGSVTNDFAVEQILLPGADGGVTSAVKLIVDPVDPDVHSYDSIAGALAEVSSVTACSLDGLKELAETALAAEAGPQPWTERVAAEVKNAIAEIEAATDADAVISAGGDGRIAIPKAQGEDDQDDNLGGTIPGSDLSWKLVGGQLVIEGVGAMPELTAETVPWSNSVDKVGSVVVGKGVAGLSKGLFTSELTAPAETVIFESKTVLIPRDAFVDAGGTVNDEVAVLFATETDGVNEAPCGWTDAADTTKTYGSYAEALADGATAVKPVFAVSSGTVEERIEKAPAVIVEKVQPYDEEAGLFTKDPDGNLIDVVAEVENVNTNDVAATNRIAASAVSGLKETARAEAEASGCTVVTLTVDAQPADPENRIQERMTWEMTDGEGFEAKFAEITLATNDVPVAESKALIEIHIPYVTEDRENFSVTRLHDGKVETFAKIDDAADKTDATFMVGKNEIVLWTDKFSLYAISSTGKVRIKVPAGTLPEGVESVTVTTNGVPVAPKATEGGVSTCEVEAGSQVAVVITAKPGYGFAPDGASTKTLPIGIAGTEFPEYTLTAVELAELATDIEKTEPDSIISYDFSASVRTTKGRKGKDSYSAYYLLGCNAEGRMWYVADDTILKDLEAAGAVEFRDGNAYPTLLREDDNTIRADAKAKAGLEARLAKIAETYNRKSGGIYCAFFRRFIPGDCYRVVGSRKLKATYTLDTCCTETINGGYFKVIDEANGYLPPLSTTLIHRFGAQTEAKSQKVELIGFIGDEKGGQTLLRFAGQGTVSRLRDAKGAVSEGIAAVRGNVVGYLPAPTCLDCCTELEDLNDAIAFDCQTDTDSREERPATYGKGTALKYNEKSSLSRTAAFGLFAIKFNPKKSDFQGKIKK